MKKIFDSYKFVKNYGKPVLHTLITGLLATADCIYRTSKGVDAKFVEIRGIKNVKNAKPMIKQL